MSKNKMRFTKIPRQTAGATYAKHLRQLLRLLEKPFKNQFLEET